MFSNSHIELKNWYFCYTDTNPIIEGCDWKEWSIQSIQRERKHRNVVWLKIQLPDFDFPEPVLYFDSIDLNFELYREQEFVYRYGNFTKNGEVIFQGWPAHIIPISTNWKHSTIYLKVISAKEYKYTGIWKLQLLVNKSDLLSMYLPYFLIFVIVSFIFYLSFLISLMFYSFNPKIVSILYFSLVSLCMGTYLFFSPQNKFLYIVFPFAFVYYTLEIFSSYFLIIFFNSYLFYVFKDNSIIYTILVKIINSTFLFLILLSIFILIFFRNKIFISHYMINVLILIAIIIFLAFLFRKIAELEIDSIYILIGVFSTIISGIVELSNFFILNMDLNALPIGSIIFLFTNLFVLSKRYIKTYKELEKKEKILQRKQEQIKNLQSLKDNFIIELSKKISEPIEEIIVLTNELSYPSSNKDLLIRILSNLKKEISRIKNILTLEYKEQSYTRELIHFNKFIDNLVSLLPSDMENKEIHIQSSQFSNEIMIEFDNNILIEILNELFFYSSNPILLQFTENIIGRRLEIQISSKNELLYPEISNFFEPYLKLDFLDTTGLYLVKKYCEVFESDFEYKIDSQKIHFYLQIPIHLGQNEFNKELKTKSKTSLRKKIFTLKNEYTLNQPKILLVHDNPYLIRKIHSILKKEYYIFCTNDLEIAFYQLESKFDLLIIPHLMYGRPINEFLLKVRKKYDLLDISIFLITPVANFNLKYFSSYVQDVFYINSENYFFNIFEFQLKIKNLIVFKEYFKKYIDYLKYQTDIQTLSNLQNHFYKKLKEDKFFRFDIKYLPAEQISGDITEIYKVSEEQYIFFIGDVTGHGLYSAFFSIFLKMILFVLISKQEALELKVLLNQINNIILEFFNQQLVTCYLVLLDATNKKLQFLCAGHLPALYFNSEKNEYFVLKPKGKILGVQKNLEFEVLELSYTSKDRLFLFTDGMTENHNKDELEKIFQFIKKNNSNYSDIEEISHKVFQEIIYQKANIYDLFIEDDITSMFIEFL